jgi:hypothetical protein
MAMKGFTNKQTLTHYQKGMLWQFGVGRELSEFNVSQRKQIGDMIKFGWVEHRGTRVVKSPNYKELDQ